VPRQARVEVAGATYHVTSRGNRRQPIFEDVLDRRRYLSLLGDVFARHGWRCLAYCLMTNHVHLIVETPQTDLGRGMHRLNGIYAQWFNWRWNVDGHLFQDRYASEIIDGELHMLEAVRYAVLNPVRAGICGTPERWPWSSHNAVMDRVQRPEFLAVDGLLAYFGRSPLKARSSYEAFVRDGLR
jgi:REP element-mobilizing transposase RayT